MSIWIYPLYVYQLLATGGREDDGKVYNFVCMRVELISYVYAIEQITIKTTDPKCRLYWCLVEL